MSDTAILVLALVVLGLPILSYAVVFFLGSKLPRRGDWLAVSLLGIAEALSLAIFVHFWLLDDPGHRIEAQLRWLDLGRFHIDAGILVDGMTAVMLVVVCTVSFLVHLYSVGYMHGDRRYDRYFAFLGFFTFSMLGIVLSNNLFFLFIFWELVGLSSYLLIGFFFDRPAAASANKKAFLTNRVGDWGFWMGILAFFTATGTLNYLDLFASVHDGAITGGLLTWAGLGLFCGAVGKSAQMPLHIWLPDAMEGPTPVSALIHAATMVAAGVYMVARLFPLFSPDALLVIAYVGAITAFVTATIAVVKTDIKRSLAYSTLSQLGYMVMAVGVGSAAAGMFHLTTHAFFKALLFLGAGSVIHALHTQEMPEMGGLRRKMPITFLTMLSATLAISGVPFFAGFYSKDAILASALAFGMDHPAHYLPFLLGLTAAGITAFYMFRLVFLTFNGEPRDKERFAHAHESPWVMTVPLVILGILSFVGAGWRGPSDSWFARFVAPYDVAAIAAERPAPAGNRLVLHTAEEPATMAAAAREYGETAAAPSSPETTQKADHQAAAANAAGLAMTAGDHGPEAHAAAAGAESAHDEHEAIHHKAHEQAMVLSILVAGLGILLAWLTYIARRISSERMLARLPAVHNVLQNMYFFDQLYAATIYRGLLAFNRFNAAFDRYVIDGIVDGSGYLYRFVSWVIGLFDNGVVDGLVNGVAAFFQGLGEGLRRVQVGRIQTYLVYVSFSLLVLILVYRVL
jgi:NADH-quinone oxidoreductase subunit L